MAPTMSHPLRYRADVILRDAAYGLVGISAFLWIGFGVFDNGVSMTTLSNAGLVIVILGLMVCSYLLSIAGLRATTRVTTTSHDLIIDGLLPRSVRWASIDTLVLRYFSTRRDQSNGWYKLTLAAQGKSINLTSDLDGFETILNQAFKCARHHSVSMNASTLSNLSALGLWHDDIGGRAT